MRYVCSPSIFKNIDFHCSPSSFSRGTTSPTSFFSPNLGLKADSSVYVHRLLIKIRFPLNLCRSVQFAKGESTENSATFHPLAARFAITFPSLADIQRDRDTLVSDVYALAMTFMRIVHIDRCCFLRNLLDAFYRINRVSAISSGTIDSVEVRRDEASRILWIAGSNPLNSGRIPYNSASPSHVVKSSRISGQIFKKGDKMKQQF